MLKDEGYVRHVLGFDFGLKYIGVAAGQTLTRAAQPLTTLAAKNGCPNWDACQRLISTWCPSALIVGIPVNMDGTEQWLTQAARQFSHELEKRFSLPVYTVDERLSTKEARSYLFEQAGYRALQKEAVDATAARLILETWLQNIDIDK